MFDGELEQAVIIFLIINISKAEWKVLATTGEENKQCPRVHFDEVSRGSGMKGTLYALGVCSLSSLQSAETCQLLLNLHFSEASLITADFSSVEGEVVGVWFWIRV